jgi:type IV pilus assembly protein PilM
MISFGLGRKKRTVGLDVGSGLLKVAVMDHSGDGPRLEDVAYRAVPPGAITEGEVTEPDVLGDSIEDLFRESGIDSREVAVALDGRDVIIKAIEMDRMSEEDAREVIRWEAEQHVPFDMENVQLDFVITDPEGEGLEMNVLLVAAKRDLVEQRVGWLREQGLKPRIVDVGAFALHNALEFNHPESLSGFSALVAIGHSRTVVNVLDEGVPVMSRELSAGTARIRRRLEREFQVEAGEAEAAVRGAEGAAGLDEVVSGVAQEIARGVERSALFLESREDFGTGYEIDLGRLWVCGGGVGVPGLLEALARRLDVETHVTNPVARLSARPGALGGPGADLPPAAMMQAVGLALRGES